LATRPTSSLNEVGERYGKIEAVHFFNAGLSTRARRENAGGEELNFLEGVPFVIANVPGAVDLLKMDCEGCEYPMFEDERLLDHLAPAEIVMRYHQGERAWSTKSRRACSDYVVGTRIADTTVYIRNTSNDR
jgi:hypothetical protein